MQDLVVETPEAGAPEQAAKADGYVARPGGSPFRRRILSKETTPAAPPMPPAADAGKSPFAGPTVRSLDELAAELGGGSNIAPPNAQERASPWEDAISQAQRWLLRAVEAHERQVFELQSEVARLSGRPAPKPPAATACASASKRLPDPGPAGGGGGGQGQETAGSSDLVSSQGIETAKRDAVRVGQVASVAGLSDDPLHFSLENSLKRFWQSQLSSGGKSSGSNSMIAGLSAKPESPKATARQRMLEDPTHDLGCWKYFVASPSSRWRLVWDLMGSFFLFLDLVMIPMQAFGSLINNDSTPLMVLTYATSCYWTADFMLSFFVGYHIKGVVEMHAWKIATHYFRTWFVMDFSLVIVDWCFIFMGLGQQASAFRTGKTMSRGMRVLRLLRIVKMHSVVSDIMERIRSEYMRTVFQICTLVFFIVIVNHISACAWYGLSYLVPADENTWVKTFLREDDTLSYRYATSLHWSLTQFTPAGMEVYAKNELERVYSVCLLLFALITFSSFVSSITNLMNHLRSINAQRLEQQKKLRLYLFQHGISSLLVNRVWHYLHHREVLNSVRTRTKEADVPVLTLLPASMRAELRHEAFSVELKQHPFFFHYGFAEKGALLQICDSAVDEVSLLARAELFSSLRGEAVKMFFVIEGVLEYSLPCRCWEARISEISTASEDAGDQSQNLWGNDEDPGLAIARAARAGRARVRPGQWCCEAALWVPEVHLASPFVSKAKTELVVINTAEFQKIVSMYSTTRQQVAKYAETFVEHLPSMTSCRWLCCMCNDFSQIEDLVHRVFDYESAAEAEGKDKAKRSTRRTRRASARHPHDHEEEE